MSTLRLRSIHCYETTAEATDEIYIQVAPEGGSYETVWGPHTMDDGDVSRVREDIQFDYFASVKVWEHDEIGDDEHIGEFTVNPDLEGEGEQTARLTGHRAEYKVFYEVTEDNVEAEPLFELRLKDLKCNDAQEYKDEPYIVVNGRTVWSSGRMKTGDRKDVNKNIRFRRHALVELWEHDISKSDNFGSHQLDAAEHGEDTLKFISGPRTKDYRLTYDIVSLI